MQINLCHYAKTKSVKVDFVVASGNKMNNARKPLFTRVFGSFCFVGVTKLYRFYTNNLNKFTAYPDDIEQRATAMFLLLAKKLTEKENVTEQLKSTNQMKWVAWMNNIRSSATEIVNNDIIYN